MRTDYRLNWNRIITIYFKNTVRNTLTFCDNGPHVNIEPVSGEISWSVEKVGFSRFARAYTPSVGDVTKPNSRLHET